jgi:hypothetical protein
MEEGRVRIHDDSLFGCIACGHCMMPRPVTVMLPSGHAIMQWPQAMQPKRLSSWIRTRPSSMVSTSAGQIRAHWPHCLQARSSILTLPDSRYRLWMIVNGRFLSCLIRRYASETNPKTRILKTSREFERLLLDFEVRICFEFRISSFEFWRRIAQVMLAQMLSRVADRQECPSHR